MDNDYTYLAQSAKDYLFKQKDEELKESSLAVLQYNKFQEDYAQKGDSLNPKAQILFQQQQQSWDRYFAAERNVAVARTALGMVSKSYLKEFDKKMEEKMYTNSTAVKYSEKQDGLNGGYGAGEKRLEANISDFKRNYTRKERKKIKKEAKELVKKWKADGQKEQKYTVNRNGDIVL